MTSEEHLLQKLSEECAEVIQAVSKALLFGLDDMRPGGNITNEIDLYNEINDINAIVEMLNECGVLNYKPSRSAIDKKKEKVEKFMDYAENRGTLTATF